MSEERLTVAELMARAAKEGHSTDAPRRRRRRSLEDGGVSVAELTGSIPAVKEKPAESRHSAVKIDDPVQPSAPKTPQTPKAEDSASAPEPAVAPEAPVKVPKIAKDPAKTPEVAGAAEATEAKAEPKVDPEAELKTKPQAQPKAEVAPKAAPEAPTKPVAPAKKTAPAAPVTPTQSAKPTAVVEPVAPVKPVVSATTPKVKESAPEKGAQQDKPAPVRSAPSEDETMVLSIVDEKDPIRLTTGAFPVVPASAVKPAQVQQTPANTQDAEAAADAEFATTGSEGRAGESPADTTQLDTTTGELEATDGAEDDQDQESGKVSVFSVLLMAVVGVVLGAAVFLAFEMLWERLNNWLVGILAIAVTLGMVGIVHALRTSRDGFSMVLAGVVGLVMTFGPLLIVF